MELVRRLRPQPGEDLGDREWLVSNGLGGYASGLIAGWPARRYHGLLISSLAPPLGRTVMFNHLEEVVIVDGRRTDLGPACLEEFRLEWGLPIWIWRVGDVVVERRLVMPHLQNTTHLSYRLAEGGGHGSVGLALRPWLQMRGHEDAVDASLPSPCRVVAEDGRYEVTMGRMPPLRLSLCGPEARLSLDGGRHMEAFYQYEADRGYAARGSLWSSGRFRTALDDKGVTLVASTESWHVALAMDTPEVIEFEDDRRRRLVSLAAPPLRQGAAAELVVAADSFVIVPRHRVVDQTRARSAGEDVRTVIAGYHWFTDWGRDTMIGLEGLTLVTGRFQEARWILHTFAHYVRDGLIPNMFPEHGSTGLYHTADATLWFFHALDRYLHATGDLATLHHALPTLRDILRWHRAGTGFGIHMDPGDGLLCQGAEGYQLTWMDAKVDGWVVTPRRGKAVEINALWYNALCLMARWLRECGDENAAAEARADAGRARDAFNRRFWNPQTGYLFDVVDGPDGDDPACRPNQVFAVSLPHPVLDEGRWQPVVHTVRERLLTPAGLRSLAPGEPEYKPRYFGNLRTRDAAYHQGTVWAWLIGPFVDAWLKLHPEDTQGAREALEALLSQLDRAGIGTISEVFDADPPFTPRGCISQAWSVAEWLRAWVRVSQR